MTKPIPLKETKADKAVRRGALENSGEKLAGIVGQLEAIAEEIRELKSSAKVIHGTAKGDGYDPKAIKAVIRERARTDEERAAQGEFNLVVATYLESLDVAGANET